MLKIADADRLNIVIQHQQKVGGYTSYLKDVLEPIISRGDWDELEQMPIGFNDDGDPLGYIKDDVWKLTDYFYPNQSIAVLNLHFTHDGRVLERNIKNEIKTLILKMLWLSHRNYSLDCCYVTVRILKKFAFTLLNDGANSFSLLSFERIEAWILRGVTNPNFKSSKTYNSINRLIIEKVGLPFKVTLKEALKASDFGLSYKEKKQFIVLPPRLYFSALKTSKTLVEELYKNREELGALTQLLTLWPENYAKNIHRKGRVVCLRRYFKKSEDFESKFYAMEFRTEQKVIALVKEYLPPVVRGFEGDITEFNFKNMTLSANEAVSLLRDYVEHCKFIIMALTGMRIDELHSLHWNDGIENSIIEGQEINALRADLSKTTGNSQARQDTFVTTDVGKKAYEVLNEIMTPLRNSCKPSQQNFFHSFETGFYRQKKYTLSENFSIWFSKKFSKELVIDLEDMKYLSISDPEQKTHKLGDAFRVTPHQLRRTFAYYLVGYELLSFPQLKQQFSHFSTAMTRYYAKNASKFQKWYKTTYDEVNDERITQQAYIYLHIYQKLANNDRVAGGKGKAFAKQMLLGHKENLFTDRTSNDMLSLTYWENAIRKKKRHLHVVAPGVICTSTNCSMRTTVSLLDCVDCDNDYIVDAVFAEANRKSAEINMLYDIEHGELTASSATESYKKIIAAQRIMDDLGIGYDPVVFPSEVKEILVPFMEL